MSVNYVSVQSPCVFVCKHIKTLCDQIICLPIYFFFIQVVGIKMELRNCDHIVHWESQNVLFFCAGYGLVQYAILLKKMVTISSPFCFYNYPMQLYPCFDMKHLWPLAIMFWNELHSRWKLSFKRQDRCCKCVACCISVHLFIPDAHSTDWVCREQFSRKSTSRFTRKSPFRDILELSKVWPKLYKFLNSFKLLLKCHMIYLFTK